MRHVPPTPPQIAATPELALLSSLEFTLEVCVRTLVAAHPVLDGVDPPQPLCPQAYSALSVVSQLWRLKLALQHYRELAAAAPARACAPDDDDAGDDGIRF
jgi:hypothetical protein